MKHLQRQQFSFTKTSDLKQYYRSYTHLGQNALFHNFFKTNCTQSIFTTINRGHLAKPFKKFLKSPIRPAGSHFWQNCSASWSSVGMNINRVTLQHNKESIALFFFSFNDLITMCNQLILQSVRYGMHFVLLLYAIFMNDWKQTTHAAIKTARETTKNK